MDDGAERDVGARLLRRVEALRESGSAPTYVTTPRYEESPDPDWLPEDGVYTDDMADADEAWAAEEKAYWHAVRTRREWRSPDDFLDPTQKTCIRCHETYDKEYGFHRCRASPDGRFVYCRWCHNAYMSEYRKRRTVERRREKELAIARGEIPPGPKKPGPKKNKLNKIPNRIAHLRADPSS